MKYLLLCCTVCLLSAGSFLYAGEQVKTEPQIQTAAKTVAGTDKTATNASDPDIIWTPAMLEYTLGGPDPIGGWNRGVFAVNDALMLYLVRPVSWVYSSILPKPVIDILWNMCRNLEYPMHVFSCLGAAEWTGAWDETRRFFVNTTLGLAGMLDPAQDWFHWHRTDSNFGRMFYVWGIDPGCTFMFPFASFVNVRDGVGTIFDYAFDLRTYIPYSSWVYANEAVIAETQYNNAMKTVVDDRYHQYRILMLAKRELQLNLWEYRVKNAAKKIIQDEENREKAIVNRQPEQPAGAPDHKGWNVTALSNFSDSFPIAEQPYLDSLYSTLFTPQNDHSFWYLRRSIFNRDFISLGKHRELALSKESAKFDYYFWDLKKEDRKAGYPERLVIILPGIGSSPDGNSALAMAELFNDHGWKAVTVWSAFTAQFMESAGHGALPGYAPRDAANMRSALKLLLADLRKDELIGEKPWITLLGWSFGGLHTLHIASLEEQQNILGVNRYVALNPPADLDYALSEADKLALTSKGWSREKAVNTIAHALGSAFVTAQESSVTLYNPNIKKTRDARLPYIQEMSPEQAKFLISLSMNSSLRSVILSRHLREPIPGLIDTTPENRQYLNLQLDLIPYRAYGENYVLLDKTVPQTYAELAEKSCLKAIEPTLKNNPDIRVFHSLNDFLVSPEQRQYMQNTLGNRIFWFDRGGHLGYWSEKKALDMIYEASCQPGSEPVRKNEIASAQEK